MSWSDGVDAAHQQQMSGTSSFIPVLLNNSGINNVQKTNIGRSNIFYGLIVQPPPGLL